MTTLVSPATLPPSRARSTPPTPASTGRSTSDGAVPMTRAAWSALRAEAARDVRSASGGIDQEAWLRHRVIADVLEQAAIVEDRTHAVVGRRVTVREPDGTRLTFALVIPGDGDPRQGWIAIDAPLGQAILGAHVGDQVTVHAPSGPRIVRIEAVA